jgi:PAS domain S-box-containing protein
MNQAPQKKILVVDDQPENIHVLIENLESEYEILYATSGQKALDIAFSDNRPDLILLDIIMPGIDGYEVCRRLKDADITRDIPVIFITSQWEETDETEGIGLGAADYIIKPFRLPVVEARIKAVLRLKEEMDKRMFLARELEDLNRNLEERIRRKTRDLRKAHDTLKTSELIFRTIFENAIEGIFQTTPDGRLLNASPSLARIVGYDSVGSLLDEVPTAVSLYVKPEDREEFRAILEQNGKISDFETQLKKKDGSTIWAMLSAKVIRNEDGAISHYQGFVIDISEHRRAAELELANIRLRELDTLKSALLSTASHDMRSPMTAILGFSDLAKQLFMEHFLPLASGNQELEQHAAKIKEQLEIIEGEGWRLIRLVNDFLDISKFESGCSEWNDKPVQMNDIGEQALKVIGGQILTRKTVRLESEFAPDLPLLICDPDRMMQVMINLLGNAAKFTREGTIRIRTHIASSNRVEVRVEDTGVGIPDNEKERIFEKFHRIKQDIVHAKAGLESTGLGLAICKQIVEHYGGRIWVESKIGEGSAFIFQLPLVREERRRH